MSSCAKCIFKPFCHSAGYVCSSFKDKDRFADRNEVIREFAERLKPKLSYYDWVIVDTLVEEMTGEAEP